MFRLKNLSQQFIEEKEIVDGLYVKVTLENKKPMIIKKSSLCWLLEKHREIVSSYRFRRIICSNNDLYNNFEANTSNEKVKTKAMIIITPDDSDHLTETESEFTTPESPYRSDQSYTEENSKTEINLEIEKYYAVRYDINWYIGRLIKIKKNFCTFKFLKADLDKFTWPKSIDLQEINKSFIFYGPINLYGVGLFSIKRFEQNAIVNKFKLLKNKI